MARPRNATAVARRVLEALRARRILLQAGNDFPSVTSLVLGGPVSGSWWAHPQSNLVYWVLQDLNDHDEVLTVKLVDRKATLVHRSLWPALLAIGRARQRWQTRALTPLSRSIDRRARRGAPFRVDALRPRVEGKPGDAVRLLEARMLVFTEEVHTESGRHVKVVSGWQAFAAEHPKGRLAAAAPAPDVEPAKAAFETALADYPAKLPWM